MQRKVGIVLLSENARIDMKSSANESRDPPDSVPPSSIPIHAELREWWSIEVGCMVHVRPPDIQRKFGIVLFSENARIDMKSSAMKSWDLHMCRRPAPSVVMIREELSELWSVEVGSM